MFIISINKLQNKNIYAKRQLALILHFIICLVSADKAADILSVTGKRLNIFSLITFRMETQRAQNPVHKPQSANV